jgi:hypothetical protein
VLHAIDCDVVDSSMQLSVDTPKNILPFTSYLSVSVLLFKLSSSRLLFMSVLDHRRMRVPFGLSVQIVK